MFCVFRNYVDDQLEYHFYFIGLFTTLDKARLYCDTHYEKRCRNEHKTLYVYIGKREDITDHHDLPDYVIEENNPDPELS